MRLHEGKTAVGLPSWLMVTFIFPTVADGPLFITLKRVVSTSHALPKDLLPTARTVVVFSFLLRRRWWKTTDRGLLHLRNGPVPISTQMLQGVSWESEKLWRYRLSWCLRKMSC